MAFIPEITTRVTVDMDTSDLDQAISLTESDSILSELGLTEILEETKSKINDVKTPLTEAVASRLQSNQENIISSKHYITGMMASSVDQMNDGDDILVGNTAESVDGFPYPLAIETGRREVFPVNAKVLRWFDGGIGGTPVFSMRSSAVAADPFVDPSIDDTMYDIDTILEGFDI